MSKYEFDFLELNDLYFDLLINEDFDFKTKNIKINFDRDLQGKILVFFVVDSIIDLKIASNSLIKSLEIIQKTYSNI